MNRHILIVGAAIAALSVAACGQKDETKGAATPAEQAATPDANPAMTAVTPADETKADVFVAKASEGNLGEIEAGKLAQTKATDPKVKEFAKRMVADHTKTGDEMGKAITASGLPLTPVSAPTDDINKMLSDLNGASPEDFDKTYIDGQIDAHHKVLDLLQHYAQAGDNKALQDFAAKTAPAVQEHLTMAEGIKKTLK
jgi:putative membrane protein